MFFVVLKLFLGLKERLVNTIHECLSLNFSEIISINMKEARKLRLKACEKAPVNNHVFMQSEPVTTCVSIKFDLKRLCQWICKGVFCVFWNILVSSSENLTAFSTNNLKIDRDNFLQPYKHIELELKTPVKVEAKLLIDDLHRKIR